MEDKKKFYSKPVIKKHGDLKKVTKRNGPKGGDAPMGSVLG